MFFNIEGKKILLIGAGSINLRRVNTLLEFGAELTVVAPEAREEILAYAKSGKIAYEKASFTREMVTDEYFMVIAATNDPKLNYQVTKIAREHGILTNNAADKTDCDFYFPAIVREDAVIAGVCAGGSDHRLVRKVAAGMRNWLHGFLTDH